MATLKISIKMDNAAFVDRGWLEVSDLLQSLQSEIGRSGNVANLDGMTLHDSNGNHVGGCEIVEEE